MMPWINKLLGEITIQSSGYIYSPHVTPLYYLRVCTNENKPSVPVHIFFSFALHEPICSSLSPADADNG